MKQEETKGNTRPTLLNPLRSHGHMVGVSIDIMKHRYLTHINIWSIWMWYLAYHWQLQWDNQGSCGNKSFHVWLRRAIIQNKRLNNFKENLAQILLLHKHLRFRLNIQNCMKQLATFLLQQKVFLQAWLTKDSFPQRGFMFPQATSFLEHKVVLRLGSHRVFSSLRFLLFREHTDSPIVGASDMSQVSTYPFM